jgi:myo-inositol-hexaphosphate 3-phosphohydrolase
MELDFSPSTSTHCEEDLDKLAIWEVKWMMKFHPDKCQVLAITKKKTLIKKNYNLHDHTFEHVSSAKYLGDVSLFFDFTVGYIQISFQESNNFICILTDVCYMAFPLQV